MKTDHPEIFEKFNIPLHYKVQGRDCITKAVTEYFKLFEKEDENDVLQEICQGNEIRYKSFEITTKNI